MEQQDGTCTSKPCTLLEAVNIYKNLFFEERCFLHKAILGQGPYILAPGFEHLGITETKFSRMNIEQRREILARVDPFLKPGNIEHCIANGLLLELATNC